MRNYFTMIVSIGRVFETFGRSTLPQARPMFSEDKFLTGIDNILFVLDVSRQGL